MENEFSCADGLPSQFFQQHGIEYFLGNVFNNFDFIAYIKNEYDLRLDENRDFASYLWLSDTDWNFSYAIF